MQHDLRGSTVLLVQRILINPLPLISNGEEKKKGAASVRQTEDKYCHQCQRGRLLEILSLMAKELAKTGAAPKLSIRQNKQRGSRGCR